MKELFIKVCGLRDPKNIVSIDEIGVDYLGFIFYAPSKRNALQMDEIPSVRAKKVGVFVNESFDAIISITQRHQLQGVQLHGEESPVLCRQLKAEGLMVWKVFGIDQSFDFNALEPYLGIIDAFLFDTKSPSKGGTGVQFDWKILEKYPYDLPFILSGGLDLGDAQKIKNLHLPNLIGVDINSKFELSPGNKDRVKVKNFVSDLRS